MDRPINAGAMVLAGIYFMTREIELSGALQHELSLTPDGSTCQLLLPASKKDPNACGVIRTVECMCGVVAVCPSHCLQQYVGQLAALGDALGMDSDALPLFPNPRGEALKKHQVVDMARDIVKGYLPDLPEETVRRFSGHTFRITGARHFAELGMDPLTIAIHGRWSSNAILTYLSEAPLQCMRSRMKSPTEAGESQDAKRLQPDGHDPHLLQRLCALEEINRSKQKVSEVIDSGYVVNMLSSMVHKQKQTDEQTHNWATKCGWKWAGKKHVHSYTSLPDDTQELKWNKCPKCFNLLRKVSDDNSGDDVSSSSSSSDSDSPSTCS